LKGDIKMQEVIQFLINNGDVLNKVKEGTVSLLDVNAEEVKAILEVFFNGEFAPKAYFWH